MDKGPSQVYAVASPFGVTFVFSTKAQLIGMIEHLQGMLEWAQKEDISQPYIYHIAHEQISTDELDKWTNWAKYAFGQGSE